MPNTDSIPDAMDRKQIEAAARKALMAANAHYYAWPKQQQERFRITMGEKSRNQVRRVLLDNILSIKCSDEEVDKVWNDIPLPKLNALNWASLLTSGIGEDYIYLNESLAEGKSLLDFSTLYDYDYDDYLIQEQARQRDLQYYRGADYYACRYSSWVRLLINGHFYYATFHSLAGKLTDDTQTAGDDYIEQLIPHKYIEGKDNGKAEKGGFLWDMQLDADGQEGQLDELRSRWYSYLQEQWLGLGKINYKLPPAVYTQDEDWGDEPHRFFIFTNEATLKKIRWRRFLSDCKPLLDDFSAVKEQLESEINSALAFLTETHQHIHANFNPNIIKLRKKRRIIMSPGVLDDLGK